MGGPSTGGGNGGVGPAGKKKDGTYGKPEDAEKVSKRNETRKAIKEFEPLPVKIIKSIIEAPKKNKKSKSGDVYSPEEAKEKIDYKTPVKTREDNNGANNPPPKKEVTKKSIEQPKVKSQINNTEVKSKAIIADKVAPTKTETKSSAETIESADDILLKNKRKGRKKTVLTSVTGVEGYPTLSKRTLLGG